MSKYRVVIVCGITAVVLVPGLLLLSQCKATPMPEPMTGKSTSPVNLGITYLPITPGLADYYGLEVSTGVLVTEVVAGSPADLVGVQVGDIILSYNGTQLGDGVSLFGMMKMCPAGSRITMEIQRQKNTKTLELIHRDR